MDTQHKAHSLKDLCSFKYVTLVFQLIIVSLQLINIFEAHKELNLFQVSLGKFHIFRTSWRENQLHEIYYYYDSLIQLKRFKVSLYFLSKNYNQLLINQIITMQGTSNCGWRYHLIDGVCEHYLIPPSIQTIIGSIAIAIVAGVSSIAGLGGGGTFLIILLLAFNYSSKSSTIIVFPCIVGATMGNLINQMRKSLNNKPLIQYHFAFVSIPLMFTGSFIGVLLNKVLPSVVIVGFICLMTGISIKKVFEKFIVSYRKQTQQNEQNQGSNVEIIAQQIISPFQSQQNVFIFKNLAKIVCVFLLLQLIKGSQKFPSIVGIQPCSFLYWTMYLCSFLIIGLFAYFNVQTLRVWMAPQNPTLLEQQYHNPVEDHLGSVIGYSIMAGVFSGFGLGGGIFLVPMYRSLGCSPLQATSSCAFSIFTTAVINCSQGVFLGVIPIEDLIYLFLITCSGSYIISKLVTTKLREMNRLSIVQGIMLLLIINAFFNIPYSLYTRYVRSGYNNQQIFGFGTPC